MRSSHIPAITAFSLLLSSCAVVTTSGTEEALFFSDEQAKESQANAVLKPHSDVPLAVEFSCPAKLATMMTSIVVPFPPLVPVGFVNKHVSYLKVTTPEGAGFGTPPVRVTTQQGRVVPVPEQPDSRRVVSGGGATQAIYALSSNCEDLDGGVVEVARFSHQSKDYPATRARLRFDSRIRMHVGPGLG